MEKSRRNSRKRQALLDVLCDTKTHPSAEQLYEQLKPDYPDLSLGTVYRNLGVLLENGSIISVGKVNGEDRYDACTAVHAHFICSGCGAVIDVNYQGLNGLDYAAIESQFGGSVRTHSLLFAGLCGECSKKEMPAEQ